MSAYAVYSPSPSVTCRCPICFDEDSSENQGIVAHTELGQLHPLHRACARLWFKTHDTCPNCSTKIDKRSLFTWKERYLPEATLIAGDACKGAVSSTLGGIYGATVRRVLGGISITGIPMTRGRPEASGAAVGLGLPPILLNIRGIRVQTLISRVVATMLVGQIIESVTMAELPILGNPIVASAVVGAVAEVALGVFERHWR